MAEISGAAIYKVIGDLQGQVCGGKDKCGWPSMHCKASRTGMHISRKLTQAVCGLVVSIISFPFALLLVQKYTNPHKAQSAAKPSAM